MLQPHSLGVGNSILFIINFISSSLSLVQCIQLFGSVIIMLIGIGKWWMNDKLKALPSRRMLFCISFVFRRHFGCDKWNEIENYKQSANKMMNQVQDSASFATVCWMLNPSENGYNVHQLTKFKFIFLIANQLNNVVNLSINVLVFIFLFFSSNNYLADRNDEVSVKHNHDMVKFSQWIKVK